MARLNIGYDLLTWEGDILRLHFWTHAFEFLKRTGAVFLQTEGKLKGCWVMRIEDEAAAGGRSRRRSSEGEGRGRTARESHRPIRRHRDLRRQGHGLPAVEVRPARQGLPLSRRSPSDQRQGAVVDDVRRRRARRMPRRRSAAPSWVCNVIDTRQSYLQKLVKQALAALGYHEQAAHSVHYSYEMVALSHSTARELGYDTSADADRPFVEVSGRKGLGVKADDLIDRLTDKASQEVARRNADLPAERRRRIAEAIAIAAVRYFMVKFSRGKVIVFDIDEALSFEGESGPYLQYAVVRANNIFNKLKERRRPRRGAPCRRRSPRRRRGARPADSDEAHDVWGLVLEAARLDEIVEQAVRTLELSVVAKYAFGLAQAFNGSITATRSSTRSAPTPGSGAPRPSPTAASSSTTALDLMGMRRPGRM